MLFKHNKFLVAVYLRLSREDGDKTESDSIGGQRQLIHNYLSGQPTLQFVKEYIDDGYTGSNFDRPGFIKMMEDVRRQKINCIIVKDLSRFGRNYIEVGRYIDKKFPAMGIRFIAINDQYDNAKENNDTEQIIVPFKNLINDAYCRDISIKVRSQLDVKRKKGDFIGSFAAYGYVKDPKNKNHLVIDTYAAEIVRLVFHMKLDGFSAMAIAEELNNMGVLPPMEYKRMCGYNYNSGFRTSAVQKWGARSVLRILENELYTGVMVQGKNQKINYKVKKSRAVDCDQWIKVPDTHEAIIPREYFERVQEMFEKVRQKYSADRTNAKKNRELSIDYFPQKVVCMDCGSSMSLERYSHSKYNQSVDGAYYTCKGNDLVKGCGKRIHEEYLRFMVIDQIRFLVANLSEQKNLIVNMQAGRADNSTKRSIDAKINHAYFKISELDEMLGTLYENYAEGLVEAEDYQMMKERYQGEKQFMQGRAASLEEDKRRMDKDIAMFIEMEKDLDQFLKTHSGHAELIDKFVERVYVSGTERMEIRFKCDDIFKRVCEAMERSEDV